MTDKLNHTVTKYVYYVTENNQGITIEAQDTEHTLKNPHYNVESKNDSHCGCEPFFFSYRCLSLNLSVTHCFEDPKEKSVAREGPKMCVDMLPHLA